ncbi:MAG: SAM-dependent methyltransferase [Candidatus Hermodarchaeota archaeon]
MKLKTSDDIRTFLNLYISSVALGTALELGLFWELAVEPLEVSELSQLYNIPSHRIHSLCELLVELNLLERNNVTYIPSSLAHETILTKYSKEVWAFLAQEAQKRFPAMNNLSSFIHHPQSIWKAQGLKRSNWLVRIKTNPEYADRFTKVLYELHRSFAEELAQTLDMTGVKRIMDIGGGSGVVSLELLKQYPGLTAVVIDLENVCKSGRQIAKRIGIADRISYQVCDYIKDKLPDGFDMVIQCDAGEFDTSFFKKIRKTLNSGGRFVIIANIDDESDQLAHSTYQRPFLRTMITFHSSLGGSKFSRDIWSVEEVKNLLSQAGYSSSSEEIWKNGTVIVHAYK